MKKHLIFGSAALIAIAAPLAVFAQMDPNASTKRTDVSVKVTDRFVQEDTNKDGMLTIDEVKTARDAKRHERREHRFEDIDTSKDGMISRAEFDAAHRMGGHGHEGMTPGENHSEEGHAEGGHPEGGHHEMGMGHHKPDMGGHGGAMFFAKADANHDGKLTLAEANTAALEMFDKVDTNKDGVATPAEKHAFHEKMRYMMAKAKQNSAGQ